MNLDTQTVLLMLAFTAAMMSLMLFAGGWTRRCDGFGKWNAGLAAMTVALLLYATRPVLPPALGVAGANALMLAGVLLQAAAVAEFAGRRDTQACPYVVPPMLFAGLLAVSDDFPFYTLVAAIGLAPALALVALRSASVKVPGAGVIRWVMAASYALGSTLLATRAGHISLSPESHRDLFTAHALDTAMFLSIFAAMVSGSLGFLILQRARAEEAVRHLSMFDDLTELLNRRAFVKLAERSLAAAARAGGPAAAMMLDLDRFKSVNDTFGHAAGDRVLADFAALLKRCVRPGDLVGRYGGEEFCVLLPSADRNEALDVAERIRVATEQAFPGELPIATTVSIGVTSVGVKSAGGLEVALDLADKALYAAKAAGRNRVFALPFVGPADMARTRAAQRFPAGGCGSDAAGSVGRRSR